MGNSITKIRLGTRSSRLALSQVAEVHLLLADLYPNIAVEIVPITTSGDKIKDKCLAEFGGKGLFVKELEEALLSDKIDIAVHSAKDVPPLLDENTVIGAYTKRIDARDCFVSNQYSSFKKLPKNAVIGTSSSRRKAYILRARPDLKVINFRGNIDTRLAKIDENGTDAIILAVSGLLRLGKENRITEAFAIEEILPAGGQGSLVLQIRKKDLKIAKLLESINDQESHICIETERAFLQNLQASCVTPVAVYAFIEKDKLMLKTAIIDFDGSEICETSHHSKVNLAKGLEMALKAASETKRKSPQLWQRIIQN